MASLTFYGGVSTIGGNCVILEENGTRLMFDNGMCFSKEGRYYKDFLNPRTNNDLRDYLELGLVPKIPGVYGKGKINDIYRTDMDPRSHYLFQTDLTSYEDYIKEYDTAYIEALFLSHCHLDHARNILFMAPAIPIYCSEITKKYLEIICDLSYYDFLQYSHNEKDIMGNRGYFPGEPRKKKCYDERTINVIRPGEQIEIPENEGTYKIRAHPVDHSVLGAMAFEILTEEGKSVIYTGDLRFHGDKYGKRISKQFLENIAPNPDALITEGTRIDDNNEMSENDVYLNMINLLKGDSDLSKKMIIASFPWKSVTRFKTLYKASKRLGRILLIQPKLAYTLHSLQYFTPLNIKGILGNEDLKIYLPRKDGMIYSKDDYKRTKYHISYDVNWSHDEKIELYSTIYGEDILITAYEINLHPNEYILHLNFYDLNELIDLQPPEGSYYFNLKTEPFDERGELEEKVLLNWIETFGLQYEMEDYHASGHASRKDLRDMIQAINPKHIFPVHTENPEFFTYPNAITDIVKGKKYVL